MVFFLFTYLLCFMIEFFTKKKIATPFVFVTLPIVLISLLNQMVMVHQGYPYLNDTFFDYLLTGYLVCFFASILSHFFCVVLFSKIKSKEGVVNLPKAEYKIIKSTFFLVSGGLFLYSLFLIFVLRVDWFNIKSYFSSGLAGHTMHVSMLASIFIYGSNEKMKKLDVLLYFMSFFPLFLYGTRGWMFIVILASIFLRGYAFNIWPNRILLFLSPIFAILFMMITYVYKNYTGGVDASFNEIFSHVMGYFLAGVQGANALFESNLPRQPYMDLVFNALTNIVVFLFGGEYVSNSTPYFFIISDAGKLSNVTTFFGTVLYGLDIYWGGGYLFFLFFIINIGFYLRRFINNIYFLMYLSLICAAMSLAFFEYYLGLLFFIESIFLLFFMKVFVSLVRFTVCKS